MPNKVTKYDGYHVSYNAHPPDSMADLASYLAGNEKGAGRAETALIVNDKFLILYGDHRQQYEKAGSLAKCLTYFKEHQTQKSIWSDSL